MSVDVLAPMPGKIIDVLVKAGDKVSEDDELVILEAMAHGRAVVASKLGAVPEMVLDGVTGRLVQPNEVVALAETVIELLGDREAISRFGAAGRQRVAEHFDPQEGFRKIQAVYDEVLIENRAGRR